MKYIKSALLVLLILLQVGCIKDNLSDTPLQRDDNTVTIAITRGLISGAKVNTIRVIAFDYETSKVVANLFTGNSTLVEESGSGDDVSNFTIKLPSKEYNFYVIANETAGMNLGSVSNSAQVDIASIALSAYTEKTVPMSKTMRIKILPDPSDDKKAVAQVWNGSAWGASVSVLNVALERLQARTTLYVRKSTSGTAVSIKQVDLLQVAPESWFKARQITAVGSSTVNELFKGTSAIATDATAAQLAKTNAEIFANPSAAGFSGITLSKNIFPENILASTVNNQASATIMRITYDYAGTNYSADVPLGDGSNYQILRNRSYDVYATIEAKGVDATLNILDWNDQALNGDIYGSKLNVSEIKVEVLGTEKKTIYFWSDNKDADDVYVTLEGKQNGADVADMNTIFKTLAGKGAANLTYNTATGEGYIDIESLANGASECKIYLRSANLKREITVVRKKDLILPDSPTTAKWATSTAGNDTATAGTGVTGSIGVTATAGHYYMGKQITLNLMGKGATTPRLTPEEYPAAYYCWSQNSPTPTSMSDANYVWYLPAQMQLQAMWITANGTTPNITTTVGNFGGEWEEVDGGEWRYSKKLIQANSNSFTSTKYWSATEGYTNLAWLVNFINGDTGGYNKTGHVLRALRQGIIMPLAGQLFNSSPIVASGFNNFGGTCRQKIMGIKNKK